MSTQFPIHPDDARQLLKIRRYLIGFRITNGWNQHQLSQMINGTNGMAWDLESNTTWQWRFSRLQDWTTPFGLRLSAQLRFADNAQLEEAVEGHAEVAPMLSLSRTQGAWKKWQRIYLTSALTVTRRLQGVSSQELGDRLGITRGAVLNWESTAEDVMLAKVLHHARALGGWIELGLEEEDG